MGSLRDNLLREFLYKESERNILHARLLKYAAVGQVKSREGIEIVENTWKEYVALEFGVESLKLPIEESQDETWLKLYEQVKKSKPKLNVSIDGKLSVSGLT